MRGVGAGHRAGESVFRAVAVDPPPHGGVAVAVLAGDADGLAVAVTARAGLSAVQRVAGAGLETRCEAHHHALIGEADADLLRALKPILGLEGATRAVAAYYGARAE